MNSTTLKLNEKEVLSLLNALEGLHTHNLDEDELATHERMLKRLERAWERI